MAVSNEHRKHYIPLESNPEVFTQLIRTLGVVPLEFTDVLSIDETQPDLLAMVPRPVFALILVFPTTEAYEKQCALEETDREEYTGYGDREDVIWFQQTIHNACGLYAILHAVSNVYDNDNGASRRFVTPNSVLDELLKKCIPLNPRERALALEASEELEVAHADAAQQGDTIAPANAEDEVDFHYVCFTKSRSGHLYELDGDKKGPIKRSIAPRDEDLLGPAALKLVKEYLEREDSENFNFSLMALTLAADDFGQTNM